MKTLLKVLLVVTFSLLGISGLTKIVMAESSTLTAQSQKPTPASYGNGSEINDGETNDDEANNEAIDLPDEMTIETKNNGVVGKKNQSDDEETHAHQTRGGTYHSENESEDGDKETNDNG